MFTPNINCANMMQRQYNTSCRIIRKEYFVFHSFQTAKRRACQSINTIKSLCYTFSNHKSCEWSSGIIFVVVKENSTGGVYFYKQTLGKIIDLVILPQMSRQYLMNMFC